MMTDDELIEYFQSRGLLIAAYENDKMVGAGFDRLIALARIGAAVQPRPIREAPKDGTPIWGFLNDMGWRKLVWLNSVVRAEYNGWTVNEETEPCWAMEHDYGDDDWEPPIWLPLSALPVKP